MMQIQDSSPPPAKQLKGCLGGGCVRAGAVLVVLVGLAVSPAWAAKPSAVKAETTEASAQQIKIAPASLTCFTMHPVDPPKGEEPRSCNSYCMEKLAVCTGVQSNRGPSPACEDGMFKGSGNCRCCTVQQ